jgi:hypothetical protein
MASRLPAGLVAGSLLVPASLAAHSLAYATGFPEQHSRDELLRETGHGYLAYAHLVVPLAFGLTAAALVLALHAAVRGRRLRRPTGRVVVCLALVAFAAQEHVERLVHSGEFPVTTVLEPTFALGIALQLAAGVATVGAARMLFRATETVTKALSARRAVLVDVSPEARVPAVLDLPPVRVLAARRAGRAPPALALS